MDTNKRSERLQVMIVSDSLAMPRVGTPYNETWVHRLKQGYPEFEYVDKSERGATTETLLVDENHNHSLLHRYDPDIVLIQLGIVDCAPRCSNWMERRFLVGVLPHKVVSRYMDVMKKLRTRKPKRAFVDPGEFESNVRTFFEKAAEFDVEIVTIAITPAPTQLIKKSPYAPESIEKYNGIYRELVAEFPNVTYVDPYENIDEIDEVAEDDGIHVDATGHEHVFRSVEKHLTSVKAEAD